MKPALILLGEMLTFVLMCFFLVLSIVTPWCTWRIICIVLCSIFGIGFIAFFFLSRNPKFKFVADDENKEDVTEEQPTEEKEETTEEVKEESVEEEKVEVEENKAE